MDPLDFLEDILEDILEGIHMGRIIPELLILVHRIVVAAWFQDTEVIRYLDQGGSLVATLGNFNFASNIFFLLAFIQGARCNFRNGYRDIDYKEDWDYSLSYSLNK